MSEMFLKFLETMWIVGILLIFHVSLLLAQEISGDPEDTIKTQVTKDIVPNLPTPLSVRSIATTSSRLIPPATTLSPDPDGNAEFYIIGGSTVRDRLYPWIVSIRRRSNNHVCAGSLISVNSVLTTASCALWFKAPEDAIVVLGSNLLNAGNGVTVVKSVKKIKYHENFSSNTSHNDIAIFTLKSSVTVSINIRPVTIGTRRTMDRTMVQVAGWGSTKTSSSLSNTLQHVTLDVLTNYDCVRRYADYPDTKIYPEQLCAGYRGENTCFGDNGDPLMQNGVLVGVLSLGLDCDLHPGIYTRVASYLSWIDKNWA